jgi:hypothetical protein
MVGMALFAVVNGADLLGATGGMVIYKDESFEPDSLAEIAYYRSVEHFPVVDNLVTVDGNPLRILPGQDPVYIPSPGDPGSTAEEAIRTILGAESRFPQFVRKLEPLRQGWAAQPRPAAPAPTSAPEATNVLRTKSGEVFESWSVSSIDGDIVTISHSAGVSRVPVADLPDAIIESNAALKQALTTAQATLKPAREAIASTTTPTNDALPSPAPGVLPATEHPGSGVAPLVTKSGKTYEHWSMIMIPAHGPSMSVPGCGDARCAAWSRETKRASVIRPAS